MNMVRTKIFKMPNINLNGYKTRCNRVEIGLTEKKKENGEITFSACAAVLNINGSWCMRGQCLDELNEHEELNRNETFRKIYRLWKLYHLNDLHAGTPEQEAIVKAHFKETGRRYDYAEACDILKAAGKYEVEHEGKPYKYGHEWIYYPIPEEDLREIDSLLEDMEWREER